MMGGVGIRRRRRTIGIREGDGPRMDGSDAMLNLVITINTRAELTPKFWLVRGGCSCSYIQYFQFIFRRCAIYI